MFFLILVFNTMFSIIFGILEGLIQVFWYSTTLPPTDPDIYSQTSPNGHLSTMATFFRPGEQKSPFIDSCLKLLYNGNLFTTSTSVPKVAIVERFNCKLIAVLLNLFYVLQFVVD